MTCPACGSDSTMVMANAHGLCFECGCDWQPERVAAAIAARAGVPAASITAADPAAPIPDAPALEPFGMATVEEVFAYDGDGPLPDAVFDPESLVGQIATLEGGQVALVISVEDDDHIGVELASGEAVIVNFSDVESIRPMPAPEVMEEVTTGDPMKEGAE